MILLFHNKYRVESTRFKDYDYSFDSVYFITICTKNREHYFGEIKNNEMNYSKIGEMAGKFWQQIPQHFPFVELDEFVVMPNHIHGIIVINKNNELVETHNYASKENNGVVETRHGASLRGNYINFVNRNNGNTFGKLKNDSLQSIINHYKGAVTRWTNKNNIQFVWQPRYYDHIIWNERELDNIREYIFNNPYKWERDRNNI